jgi:hypothetical protein
MSRVVSRAASPIVAAVNNGGETNGPITLGRAQKCTKGKTAKGSCRERMTWLITSN